MNSDKLYQALRNIMNRRHLIGEKVIVVANLKPVKLRGELSQGMILAGKSDGVLKLATVDPALENGAQVK